MNFEDSTKLIRDRFMTEISTPEDILTIFDNEESDPPEDTMWIRVAILYGSGKLQTIGSPGANYHRYANMMVSQIFAPMGKGMKDIEQLIDLIVEKFRSITLGDDILFKTPYPKQIGRQEDQSSWQTNVVCPFTINQTG